MDLQLMLIRDSSNITILVAHDQQLQLIVHPFHQRFPKPMSCIVEPFL
jgi:hypothetical protein